MQKYPFQINTNILNLTAEISELVGSMSTLTEAARSPQLRRSNRIKTIRTLAAIEKKQPHKNHLFLACDRAEHAELRASHGSVVGQARTGSAEGHRGGSERV